MNLLYILLIAIVSAIIGALIGVSFDLNTLLVSAICFSILTITVDSMIKRGLIREAKNLAKKIVLPQLNAEAQEKLNSYINKSQTEEGLSDSEFLEMEKLSKHDRVHSIVDKASKSEELTKSELKKLIEELNVILRGQS